MWFDFAPTSPVGVCVLAPRDTCLQLAQPFPEEMIPPRRWASSSLPGPQRESWLCPSSQPATGQKQERDAGREVWGRASRRGREKEQKHRPGLSLPSGLGTPGGLVAAGVEMSGIPQWPRWTRNGSQPTRRASEGAGAAGVTFWGSGWISWSRLSG